MLTWLRELAATVGTFDRSALEPGYALRCTIGVAIPLVIAAMLGKPSLGVAAAVGAFITGFTSLQGIYRTRLIAILSAAFGMAVTSSIGALAAHSTVGLIAATAVAGYACGTIGQLGPVAATVALNSLVAFVLFSSQPLAPAAALFQSALVLGGGLIQAALVLLASPTERLTVERSALADVYENLAEYARSIPRGSHLMPPVTPFATARQVLADPQPFARAAERARLDRLLEDSEVIRKRLGALATTREVPEGVADALDAITSSLRGTLKPESVKLPEISGDLGVNLRDAMLAASMLSSGRLPSLHLLSKPRPGPYVENHIAWRSPDSLRSALVMSVAMFLGRHFEADRGYWIPMTAAIVLRPDFQTTFVRGFSRIAGTLIGAVVATFLLRLLRGHEGPQVAGVIVAAAAAYLTFNPNYALFTVAITSFVVLVLSMRGLPGTTTIAARVLDTIAGGGLAMVGYLMLPTWERKRTRMLLADLLDAQRALADAILQAYVAPSKENLQQIELARTEAWRIRTTVESSIDRTRQEPHQIHTIAVGRALRILAVTQRFALANLALESEVGTPLPPECAAALAGFADALDNRMAGLAAALRESRRAQFEGRLPAALSRAETELAARQCPNAQFVIERLQAYADATTRMARLVGFRKAAPQA
jgi:uncharacterized membrane protein YccC